MNDDVQAAVDLLALARARADRAAARSVALYDLLERVRAAQGDIPPPRTTMPLGPPHPADTAAAQRRVAQLEELAAAAHERAADLYESWLRHHSGAPLAALEQQARRHREIADASRSVERLADRTLTGFEARLQRGAGGRAGSLAALAALDRLRVMVSHRVEETVEVCRREGATWEDIGSALHVTRQTAHERYRRRTE